MKIILFILIAMLGSCGIYNQYKPAKEVNDKLYGNIVTDTIDSTSFGNLSWREVFTDPQLQRLIDSALARNTDMLTAQQQIKEAEASLMNANLSYLPSFALAPNIDASTAFAGKTSTTYSIPVQASWELDIFGKVTNARRRAKAALLQSQEYKQAVQTQLISAVANNYYTLLMLDAQYQIALETEKVWSESVTTARAMKKGGMMNEAGLAQTEATYYNIHTTILDLKEQINQVENSISLLLREVPDSVRRGTLAEQQFPEKFSVGIPLHLLSNRPDVRSAEFALAQAFYATNAARAAFYPSITLNGSIGWSNMAYALSVVGGSASLIGSIAGSLTQPLFNRGAIIAQLKVSKAQQERARLTFEQTLLEAGSEVNNALMQYQTAQKKSGYYQQQITALQTAAQSTQLLMKHGSTTYLEVLTAQQTLLSASLSQVANRLQEIQGMINLYRALGGGRM